MENPEAYMYDGECLAKAEEYGKPGLVTIVERQVSPPRARINTSAVLLANIFFALLVSSCEN